jgi:hypothetical protein
VRAARERRKKAFFFFLKGAGCVHDAKENGDGKNKKAVANGIKN